MSERLKFQGRLAEKEREAKTLELRISGLRDGLRETLDPFEAIADLKADVIAAQAVDLAELHIRYMETMGEIAAIRKALGR